MSILRKEKNKKFLRKRDINFEKVIVSLKCGKKYCAGCHLQYHGTSGTPTYYCSLFKTKFKEAHSEYGVLRCDKCIKAEKKLRNEYFKKKGKIKDF